MPPLDYIPSDNVRITTEYHQERIVNADIEAVSHRCLRFAEKYGYSLDFSLPSLSFVQSDAIRQKSGIKLQNLSFRRSGPEIGAILRILPAKALCLLNFNILPSEFWITCADM